MEDFTAQVKWRISQLNIVKEITAQFNGEFHSQNKLKDFTTQVKWGISQLNIVKEFTAQFD